MATIKTIILTLVVLLTGCAMDGTEPELEAPLPVPAMLVVTPEPVVAPEPVTHAYEVNIDPSFTDGEVEVILEAIEIWNARVGRKGLVPVLSSLPEIAEWHVRVVPLPHPASGAKGTVGGWTGGVGLACDVQLPAKFSIEAAAHEIGGHCFDLEHAEERTNFMYESTYAPKEINMTDEQVALILGRLDGKR